MSKSKKKDKMDWISVADRLPPKAEEVWAYDAEEGVILAIYNYWNWHHGDSKLYQVSHWMPVDKPDPPRACGDLECK